MFKMLILTVVTLNLFAISNYEVAKKSDEVMSGYEDALSQMEMILVNSSGQTRVRNMKMKVLELDGGDKSLMEFLSPSDVKGTKFLSYEHAEKDDDQWLYLPALKRIKRIASRNKSGVFMGSEFSYEDLTAFNIDKYDYDGEAHEINIDGTKMYQTVRTPNSKNSGYTKQIAIVDMQTFLTKSVDYYDRKHELLKTATFSDYKKIDDVWRIGKIVMKNHQNDKQTTLIWKDETIKNSLKESDFHKRVLKR